MYATNSGQSLAMLRCQRVYNREKSCDTTFNFFCKRLMDLTISVLALITLLPLLLLIALLIKLDSKGPVFFVQPRVGARRCNQDGRIVWQVVEFPLFKFRSMVHNADQSIHIERTKMFVAGEDDGATADTGQFKIQNDPRITRLGHILRKTSLDEVPQALNVLRGEMSLVGPRPVPSYEVAEYDEWHFERLAALPGITGLWQVQGRGSVTFAEMIAMDIDYVRHHSPWRDLLILLQTIPAVLCTRGAA